MFDSLLDALGMAGQAASAPGDYLRGALAGKFGERASGRDLLSSAGLDPGEGTLGDIAGFGTEVATDPLTYAGAGLGRLLGGRASAAAAARGPRYATTAEDLDRMYQARYGAAGFGEGGDAAADRLFALRNSPNAPRVLSEIHPDSSILGAGAEGVAFGTPSGRATRFGLEDAAMKGRPIDAEVLPTSRTVDVPATSKMNWRVEHTPQVTGVDDINLLLDGTIRGMQDRMGARGLDFFDAHSGNVGRLAGKPVVIDPGAVEAVGGFKGGLSPVTKPAEAGPLMSRLLAMLDADRATRTAVESGLAGPNFRPELTLAGGGLGSVGGAFGRATGGPR